MALAIAEYQEIAYTSTTQPISFPSITWSTNDVIVIIEIAADSGASFAFTAPTVTGLTFTRIGSALAAASNCYMTAWRAVAASGSSGAIACDNNVSGRWWGASLWRFTGADTTTPIGNTATYQAGGTTATVSLTTSANSFVVMGSADWNATTAGYTGTPAVTNEREDAQENASQYTVWVGDWNARAATTANYGPNNTTGKKWTHFAIEVKEAAASGTNAPAGLASATGTANNAAPSVAPAGGLASATATAQTPAAKVAPAGGLASATATALDATVTRTGNPPAGLASATATAQAPGPSVAPTVWTQVAADTLTRADSATLSSTEVGAFPWVQQYVNYGVSITATGSTTTKLASNAIALNYAGGQAAAFFDAGISDLFAFEGDVTLSPGVSGAGLIFNCGSDLTQSMMVFIGVNGSKNQVQLVKVADPGSYNLTYTHQGNSPQTWSFVAGNTYRVRVEKNSNDYRVYIDGVLAVWSTATTGYESNTKFGIQAYFASGAGDADDGGTTFDNVRLYVATQPTARATAYDATISTASASSPNAGLASATATANNASASISAPAGSASATATANNAAPSVAPAAGSASATAAAQTPAASVSVSAGLASATATAYNPTVNTGGAATNANAGQASATATALDAAAKVSPAAGSASATATALDATVKVTVSAGLASATATAYAGAPSVGPNAGSATATATAQTAKVSVSITAGVATATATGLQTQGQVAADLNSQKTTWRERLHTATWRERFQTTWRERGHTSTGRE